MVGLEEGYGFWKEAHRGVVPFSLGHTKCTHWLSTWLTRLMLTLVLWLCSFSRIRLLFPFFFFLMCSVEGTSFLRQHVSGGEFYRYLREQHLYKLSGILYQYGHMKVVFILWCIMQHYIIYLLVAHIVTALVFMSSFMWLLCSF